MTPGEQRQRIEELRARMREIESDTSLGPVTRFGATRILESAESIRRRMRAAEEERLARGRAELEAAAAAITSRAPRFLPPLRSPRSADAPPLDPAAAGPFWSPTPILAFRVWHIRMNAIHGSVAEWETPSYTAGCMTVHEEQFDPDVPHTDGRCGSPPCGIYTFKDPENLILKMGDRKAELAWGVVALSGKVVEHEHGYRAAQAKAVHVVVTRGNTMTTIDVPDRINWLFKHPRGLLDHLERIDPLASRTITTSMREPLRRALLDGRDRMLLSLSA